MGNKLQKYSLLHLCSAVIISGPASLTDLCRSDLNSGKYRILCPQCDHEWQYSLIRQVAPPSAADLQLFDVLLSENYFRSTKGFQKCPGCLVWSYRDPQHAAINETSCRVTCPLCTEMRSVFYLIPFEYCWTCLREWNAGESNYCGNADCQAGADPRTAYMKSQPLKTIGQVPGCPSMRGCPKCGVLLEHTAACKHMDCKSCKFSFCFVCLKPKNPVDGQWQCGSYNAICQVAPHQTTLQPGC